MGTSWKPSFASLLRQAQHKYTTRAMACAVATVAWRLSTGMRARNRRYIIPKTQSERFATSASSLPKASSAMYLSMPLDFSATSMLHSFQRKLGTWICGFELQTCPEPVEGITSQTRSRGGVTPRIRGCHVPSKDILITQAVGWLANQFQEL